METAKKSRTFEFGGFRLDAAPRQLFGPDGASIHLSSRAFDVLLFMIERPGDLLDKATLMNAVWPGSVVEEGNLTQCIFALRRALGETVGEHRFIVTVPGRGYQFAALVETIDALPTESVTHDNSCDATDPDTIARGSQFVPPVRTDFARGDEELTSDPAPAPSISRFRERRGMWIASAIAALALVGLMTWLFWPHADASGSRASVSAGIASPQTIAILPFADLSPAGDMEYFTDGMAEELMNSLAQAGSLRVIGRGSAFAFKGTNQDARSIGEKLKVDSILEGSVRKSGERIRISARLVRTHDGFSLWSETYDRKLDDVLDIQSAIAGEVAAALSPVVHPVADEYQTRSPEAYNAYLRGIHFLRRWSAPGLLRARDELRRAVELDPQFALAHARLAEAYSRLVMITFGNEAEGRALAASSLERAVELDPRIADLWWVRMYLVGEIGREIGFLTLTDDLEQVLAASPDNGTVILLLADMYLWSGRRTEALALYERARSVDALWGPAILAVANANYLYKGNRQRALALLDEMEILEPGNPQAANLRALMAFSEGRALDWDHWKAKAVELAPREPSMHGYLSHDYVYLGLLDAAMYHARVGHAANPEGADGAYNMAHIYLFSGDVDAARPLVQRAMAEPSQNRLAMLAQAEFQYFTGDCGGAIRSLELAIPGYRKPPGSFVLMWGPEWAVILVWCLRQEGNSGRASDLARVFELQIAPPVTPGVMDGLQARMAAAIGDRRALVQHLQALVATKSMAFAFARHEPMIRPYLHDRQVKALLDTLDARRAEWRKILPASSTRVPIPGIDATK